MYYMFMNMSKREIMKAIEGKEVEVQYYESKHGIPQKMLLRFKEGQGRYGQKSFMLLFDKTTRRVANEY